MKNISEQKTNLFTFFATSNYCILIGFGSIRDIWITWICIRTEHLKTLKTLKNKFLKNMTVNAVVYMMIKSLRVPTTVFLTSLGPDPEPPSNLDPDGMIRKTALLFTVCGQKPFNSVWTGTFLQCADRNPFLQCVDSNPLTACG